jgi:SAM-dependent methyltransferase
MIEKDPVGRLLTEPLCDNWGMSRGSPVDRYYIDAFLSCHAKDIRGHVLEIGDDGYTRRFGGAAVNRIDVLDIDAHNIAATIIADLSDAAHVSSDTFDCIVLTQVLAYISDLRAAVETLVRITKPGGVILSTQPAISRVSPVPGEQDHWCWSIYPNSARWLFSRPGIDQRSLLVEGYGNLRTATAFLWGLAQEDLAEMDFLRQDSGYPLITAVRAVKQMAT